MGRITITRKDGKSPMDQLLEIKRDTASHIKLELPFQADGFKSEKIPMQPDGITPVTVHPANLAGQRIGLEAEKKEEPKKTAIEPVKPVKKPIKKK